MKVSELERLIDETGLSPDGEIYFKDDDGFLHDFRIEHRDESFDMWDENNTVPEGADIILTD